MEFIETIINGLKNHFVDKKYGVDKRFGAKKNGVALVSVGGEWTEQDGYGYQYTQDSHDTIGETLNTDDLEDWGWGEEGPYCYGCTISYTRPYYKNGDTVHVTIISENEDHNIDGDFTVYVDNDGDLTIGASFDDLENNTDNDFMWGFYQYDQCVDFYMSTCENVEVILQYDYQAQITKKISKKYLPDDEIIEINRDGNLWSGDMCDLDSGIYRLARSIEIYIRDGDNAYTKFMQPGLVSIDQNNAIVNFYFSEQYEWHWENGDLYFKPVTVDVDISTKMNIENPTGTGSFSLNRKENTTEGNYSFVEGYGNEASSTSAHAEGQSTKATNDYAHAEGAGTTASGISSHAEGLETQATGHYSHAEGYGSKASAEDAHAEGRYTTASGLYSHAEGDETKALVVDGHAEGSFSIAGSTKTARPSASKNKSQLEGATASSSHAEGFATITRACCAHAEGCMSQSNGAASHAEGYDTIAASHYQHVQGKYNISDASDLYQFIIGNGTNDSARHNCFMVDWNGAIYVQASNNANQMMKITVSSDGTITATAV